jgi:prophage DNA circulation protein
MAEGCYVPRYIPASFKGVPFEAMEAGSEHGRRGAEGEFPFGENTAYADLGRRIRRFTVKARFVRNTHVADASALIAAVESYGPGMLVHPTRGAVMVACPKLTVTDNVLEEQGVTYVDMEFVEGNQFGSGISFGGTLFGLGLSAIFEAIGASFYDQYAIESVRFYRVRDIQSTLSNRMEAVKQEFETFNARNPTLEGWNAIATMQDIVDDPAIIRNKEDAFNAFKRAMRSIANIATGDAKYEAFRRISNSAATVSDFPAEVGQTQDAVNVMVRLLAMVNMVQAALETEVKNLSEALDQYDAVVQIIDEEKAAARFTCQDDLFIRLGEFETDAKTALLKRAYGLPALVTYNFSKAVHSLVAAYEIYGDAKRFREIETYNTPSQPFRVGPAVVAPRA